MDSIQSIRGCPYLPVRSSATGDFEATLVAASSPDAATATPAPAASDEEKQRQEQVMLHFMSHVDAECFLSLLQILDPLPSDERDRAEYKRRYRELRDALTIPLPPPEPEPIGPPVDPLFGR